MTTEKFDRNIIINRVMTQCIMMTTFGNLLLTEEEKKKDLERVHNELYDYLKNTFKITRLKKNLK